MVIVQDPKRPDVSADISIPINFFPSGIRPPGAFTIVLKGWDPAKILLLVGDSTTADIGLAYCTADDKWQKLSFDEGAPSMPLDADQNETTMIGLELDLKNTTPYDVTTSTGETVSVPPPPVVWAYASDGTVTAWYVVNTTGTQYPGMGPVSALSPVLAQAAPSVPTTGPFSPVVQPAFAQSSQPTFGQPSQPGGTFGSAGPTPPAFGQPAFGQVSTPASTFGQSSTFGNPAFGQTAIASTYGQTSPPGQAPSGGGFAAFASTQVKWGQTNYGSTLSGFGPGTPAAPPPQIRPAESTESMSTDSSQDLSLGGMSLGGGGNDTQQKGGLGVTNMFGGATLAVQPATSQATTGYGGGSSTGSFLSPGVGAFAKFVPNQTDETPNRSSTTTTVEAPTPSPAFGQTGFAAAPAFGQSGFAAQPSFGHSHPSASGGFGKTAAGLGTPMSTTPIVTPVSTTSPSTFGGGSGGGFGAFASGGPATLSGAKPLETKQGTPATSGGGAFGAFASGGPSAFSQAALDKSDSSVPAWKTGGDATFGSGAGSTVFGGAPATTPIKPSSFGQAPPAASTTPSTSPLAIATSAERIRASTTTPSTSPATTTPAKSQSQSSPTSTAPTSPLIPADVTKPNAPPPASTTPAGPPPVPSAFMGLKMSTGFGLSNFNAKDSPFANRKPIPQQTVSAFGGGTGAGAMSKIPVPATPGSVFGQTSSIGTATTRAVSAFGQPAFGSPSMLPSTTTPSTTPTTGSSSSQTASEHTAFSAFSGAASAFGKSVGSGVSFGDMLRNTGASPESAKLKTPETTPRSAVASTPGPVPTTPKSAFDKSPTPQPAKILAPHDSGDEEEEEKKDEDKERRVTSAASSFSNLSSSTSSFVAVPHGGEEEDEDEGELAVPASDGGDDEQNEQQIDEFLYSEGEAEGEEEEEEQEEEENPLAETDPTVVPLPESRSPSSTPKSEGLSINVQPPDLPGPRSKAASSSRARSTTPPGSPSKESLSLQTPLEHPTPTLPSPSLSASGGSSGRPGTRPLRSSPLANTPVSGGDEEEVKGEKPTAQKPRPASPKAPFGQWDGIGKPPSPPPSESKATTPVVKVEPLIDQSNRIAPPAKERPMTPPPLATTKGAALSNKPSSSSATAAPIVASPVPMLNLSGFSLGAADAKPVVDGSTNIAIPSAFAGLKPGQLSLSPKPETSNAETPSAPDTKPLPTLGTAPKLPFGASFGALPLAAAPATMTPPKDTAPLEPMAREFMSLYTELDLELAKVSQVSYVLPL
jgi:nucleoporin NUP159